MIRTLAALDGLRGEPENLRRDPMRLRIDARQECAVLVKEPERLRAAGLCLNVSRPPLNPKGVWKYWEAHGFDLEALDGLQIRTLCTAEETALEPVLLEALEKRPEVLRRRICLFGIAVAYFSKWRSMSSPEQVERLITKVLLNAERPSSVVALWQLHGKLFSNEAANYLAQQIVSEKAGTAVVLAEKLVPLSSALSVAVSGSVAEFAAKNFRQNEKELSPECKMAVLQWIVQNAWQPPVPTDSFYGSVSQIILSKTAGDLDPFRKGLTDYIRSDNRLGDPRLRPNAPKWRSVDPQAAQRFLSWLARDSILFFFNTILPDNSHNRRRKDFWLAYHGAIRDFQVAVSEQDLWTLKRNSSSREMALFSKVNHATTSAFLMRFAGVGGDFVVAEFSETGNAAYVYESKKFESTGISLRTHQFELKRHLKHSGHYERVIHNGNWEWPARQLLSGLGIRP